MYKVEKSYVRMFLVGPLRLISLIFSMTSMELSTIHIRLKPEFLKIALQWLEWVCCMSLRHNVIILDKGFVLQEWEAAIYRCLEGYLCIFGI